METSNIVKVTCSVYCSRVVPEVYVQAPVILWVYLVLAIHSFTAFSITHSGMAPFFNRTLWNFFIENLSPENIW